MTSLHVHDVAICGYGPAGVVAAGLLGQQGLSVYVCDRLPDVYEIPRAIALDHEIMRVFQQLGVADDVQKHCEPFTPSPPGRPEQGAEPPRRSSSAGPLRRPWPR